MSSSVPATVNNLLTLMTTVLPSDSTVEFSIVQPKFQAPLTLRIYGVSGVQAPAEVSPNQRREETYNIFCELTSWAGDQDFQSRMQEVMDAWATVTVAIANDPTATGIPGGTSGGATSPGPIRWWEPTSFTFKPMADIPGMSLGCLTFDIAVEARIDSLT